MSGYEWDRAERDANGENSESPRDEEPERPPVELKRKNPLPSILFWIVIFAAIVWLIAK